MIYDSYEMSKFSEKKGGVYREKIEKLNSNNWVRWDRGFLAYVSGMDSHLYRYLLTGEEPNFALPKKNDKIDVKQGRTMVQVDRDSDDEDGKLQLKRDCDDIEADRLKYRLSKPRAMEYLDTYVEES